MIGTPEDDPDLAQLLREQEAFFRTKAKPAAQVVFPPSSAKTGVTTSTEGARQHQQEDEEKKQEPVPVLLGGIVERPQGTAPTCQPIRITSGPQSGFPKADFRRAASKGLRAASRPTTAQSSSSSVTAALPVAESTPAPLKMEATKPAAVITTSSEAALHPAAREVAGIRLDDIHAENMRRLAAMDIDDVAAAQQEILAMLSADSVEVLRGSMGSALMPLPERLPARKETQRVQRGKDESTRRTELLRRRIDTEAALARATEELMTEEEREAINWFKAPPGQRGQGQDANGEVEGEVPSPLRLDLEGKVIEEAEAEAIPVHSGLYHNPEQMAGYTLQQLCDIAHSSDQSQRARAFKTWSVLLRRGPTIEKIQSRRESLPAELPIVILAGLDDRHLAARLNAVLAMEALVVSGVDEGEREEAWDVAQGDVGWPPACGPIKLVEYRSQSNDDEEKDEEGEEDGEEGSSKTKKEEEGQEEGHADPLAEQPVKNTSKATREILQDPAVGFIRFGLLTRLANLLTDSKASKGDAVSSAVALRLLAWLAQRSTEVSWHITKRPGLLSAVERGALEGGVHEVRFLRILSQGSRQACLSLGGRGTLRACKGVLGLSHVSAAAKVEVLRLWRVALGYGADLESLLDVLPLLARPQQQPQPQHAEEATGPKAYKLCEGVWVRWQTPLLRVLYRALEAACLVVGERRTKTGEETLGGVHLDAEVLTQCDRRLGNIMATLLGSLREKSKEDGVELLAAKVHFLGACMESRIMTTVRVDEAVGIVMNAVAKSPWEVLLRGAVACKKAVLMLQPTNGVDAADVAKVDLLLGMTRMWSLLLRPEPSVQVSSGGVTASVLAGLERVREALDLVEDWRDAARGPAATSAVVQSYMATRSVRPQHSRRLVVSLEHMVLRTLACLRRDRNTPDGDTIAAQVRRFVPLCGPGSEHACQEVMMLTGLADKPSLAALYQQVILGDGPTSLSTHSRALQSRQEPSSLSSFLLHPSLRDPAPFLPLPYHWLLSALISQGGSDHALTRRLLQDTLSMLSSCASSYTRLLSPGLVLYHLLSMCLFDPEVVADPSLTSSFLLLARPTLSSIPPALLSTQLGQVAHAMQPTGTAGAGGLAHSNPEDSLQAFASDLLQAFQEGSHGLEPFTWAVRLFLHRAFPVSLRHHVWRDLAKTCLLHLLDPPTSPQQGNDDDDDMEPFLYPAEKDPQMLDSYCAALSGRYYPPLTLDRGGFALILASCHLAQELRQGAITTATSPSSGAGSSLRESQRVRLGKVMEEATEEAVDILLLQAMTTAPLGAISPTEAPDAMQPTKYQYRQLRRRLENLSRRVREGLPWPEEEEGEVREGAEKVATLALEMCSSLKDKCPWLQSICESQ